MIKLDVLVVDEDRAMRQAMFRVLNGMTVSLPDSKKDVTLNIDQAASGLETDQIVQASPPDVLIIDHELPDKNGMEIIEAITLKRLDVISVIMSSFPSVETVVNATKVGAYDFLAKPFTPEELKASLRKAVRHLMLRRHAMKLAEEQRKVRFESISVLAHELKAPLASIEGYLRILNDGVTVRDEQTYNRIINRSLVRLEGMRNLIFDLLDLTRIESGQKKRNIRNINVSDVINHCIETASSVALERKIGIQFTDTDPVHMTADAGEIEIILNNLINNAVKYNREKGRVDIAVRRDGDVVVLSVSDTGIGMSKDESEKIFDEFYRIKTPETRNITGSGLGLATVKKIVSLYHGTINVESIPMQGTTFTLKLRSERLPVESV